MSASITVSGKGKIAPGSEGSLTPRVDIQSRPTADASRANLLHVGDGNITPNVLEVTKTQVEIIDGSVSAPGLSWIDDLNTGIRRVGTDHMAFVTNGTDRLNINASGVSTFAIAPIFSSTTASQVLEVNGSKQLISTASTGTGNIVKSASPTLSGIVTANVIAAAIGSAANPAYTFTGDTDTGMFRLGTNVLSFATAGTQRLQINGDGRLLNGDGIAATPAYAFITDNTMGMFRQEAALLGFSVAGAKALGVTASSVIAKANFFFDDGGGNSGLVSNSINNISIEVAGTAVATFTAGQTLLAGTVKMSGLPVATENQFVFIDTDSGANQWRLTRDTTSSIRYKENVRDGLLVDGNKLLDIELVSWDYKQSYLDNKENMVIDGFDRFNHYGSIAEQVHKHLPEFVNMKDGVPDSVAFLKRDYLLIDLCQKQQKQIDDQAGMLTAMEVRLKKLENK